MGPRKTGDRPWLGALLTGASTSLSEGSSPASAPRRPVPGERPPGEWRVPQAHHVGHGRGQVAQAHLGRDGLPRVCSAGEEDEQGDADLRVVEAAGVPVERVLAQVFPVIGGDDHQGIVQSSGPLQVVEEQAELLVEVGDAVIVGVEDELDLSRR